MKEIMPGKHLQDPEANTLIGMYANRVLSFDDIAVDAGPRIETTMDVSLDRIGWSTKKLTDLEKRRQKEYMNTLTPAQRAKREQMLEDSNVYEAQLASLLEGSDSDEDDEAPSFRPVRNAADGWLADNDPTFDEVFDQLD